MTDLLNKLPHLKQEWQSQFVVVHFTLEFLLKVFLYMVLIGMLSYISDFWYAMTVFAIVTIIDNVRVDFAAVLEDITE